MKRYTSKFLKTVAVCYMAFPPLYIILAAILFDIPANLCVSVLLSPFYYIVALAAVLTGYGLWEMQRWSWYLFIASNILITYENAKLVSEYSATHHKFLAFLTSIFLLAALIYRVGREIRVPYFFPKIRWWESNPRYRLSVPVKVNRKAATASEPFQAEILDLSLGGCFVKIRTDIAQDETVGLEFAVFGFPLRCDGTIVWRTASTVTHPKGIGVKFVFLDKVQRRTLRSITRRLKKIAQLYRTSRYLMNQEDFLKRLEEIEGGNSDRGQGLKV
jgi:hypothetical protein